MTSSLLDLDSFLFFFLLFFAFLKHTPRSNHPPKHPSSCQIGRWTWEHKREDYCRASPRRSTANDVLVLLHDSGDHFIKITCSTVGHPTSKKCCITLQCPWTACLVNGEQYSAQQVSFLSSPLANVHSRSGLYFASFACMLEMETHTGIEWHCWNKTQIRGDKIYSNKP